MILGRGLSHTPILLDTPAVLTLSCEECGAPRVAVVLRSGDVEALQIVCAACAQDNGVRADQLTRERTNGRLCFDTEGPLYQYAEGIYSLLILGGFSETEHAPHVREIAADGRCEYCADVDR